MSLIFSEQNDKIAAAYVMAQKNVKRASKDANNPHFKAKYADLESVDDACRDAYHAQGIGIIQAPGLTVDGKMHMATMLLHESGQHVSSEMSVPLSKSDAQAYGSAVTYARRYALAAMTGVIAGDDDDGNAASAPTPRREPVRQQAAPATTRGSGSISGTSQGTRIENGAKNVIDIANEIGAELDEIATQFPGKPETFLKLVQTVRQCGSDAEYENWKGKNLAAIVDVARHHRAALKKAA